MAFYLSALVRTDGSAPTWLRAALSSSAVYFIVASTASVAAALVSWHCCEKHFLKLEDRFAYKPKNSKEPGKASGCEAAEA